MSKVFEDYFSEYQADMVAICLEYVDNRADNIFIHCSYEANIIACEYFYKINGQIIQRHRLNEALKGTNEAPYDTSVYVQKQVIRIIDDDIKKIVKLCREYNREMPTEMKITYDVKKNSLNADYSYDLKFSNDLVKTSDDIAMEWFNEIKQKYSK